MMVLGFGFWATQASGILLIAVTVVWICGIFDLMTKRPDLDGKHKSAWILIIVIFPLLGTLGYFYLRPTLPHEREQMLAARQP